MVRPLGPTEHDLEIVAFGEREQARVIQLVVDRIDYDGKNGTVSITFHPNGLKTLAVEQAHEVAA